jgi:hypothetical protein
MPVEIEITSQAVREALEAALWHREYRHVCADDRKVGCEESAFSRAVGQAWTDNPLHDRDIEASAPDVWQTLRRLTRLRTRIFEVRNEPDGTVLRWNVDPNAFRESLADSRLCVQEPDGSLIDEVVRADRERVLAFLQASAELERHLESDLAVA